MAMRLARRSPFFYGVAVLTLGCCIGASVSVFSVFDGALLRPLKYRDPDRLVLIREQISRISREPMPVPAPDTRELIKSAPFDQAGIVVNRRYDVALGDSSESVLGARISPNLLELLGTRPLDGRLFTPEEDAPGRRVVILNYDFWRRLTGGDPSIVGRSILVDREPYRVVGIMPSDFVFPPRGLKWEKPAELFVPLALTPREMGIYVDNSVFGVVGHLKPGITPERASQEMKSVARGIQATYPPEVQRQLPQGAQLSIAVVPMREAVIGDSRRTLFLLIVAVGCLVFIGCANVANMLLSRAGRRAPEMAVRLALGASWSRLVRQLLTEALLLNLAGGVLGVSLAWVCRRWIFLTLPSDLLHSNELTMDWRILVPALLLCCVTTMLFGLIPAVAVSRAAPDQKLREGGRNAAGRRRTSLAGGLVVFEVALTVVLQVGAVLLVRSLLEVHDSADELRPAQILTASVSLPVQVYRDDEAVRTFYRRLLSDVSFLPSTLRVGAASSIPFSGSRNRVCTIEELPASAPSPIIAHTLVLGSYFEALGIPLRRGRMFNDDDRTDSARVVLINETAARKFWPDQDPVGKRLKWGLRQTPGPWLTVVGVVGDVSQDAPDKGVRAQVYEPLLQDRFGGGRSMTVVLRAAQSPTRLEDQLRTTIRRVDPGLPIGKLQTLERVLDETATPRRATTWLLSAFAVAALFLASIGLFGVMASQVSERRQEIAIRIAVGATPTQVAQFVLRRGMFLIGLGLTFGWMAAIGLTRFVASLLYGVRPLDPWAYCLTVVALAVVGFAALYSPVRIACRIDSASTLRG